LKLVDYSFSAFWLERRFIGGIYFGGDYLGGEELLTGFEGGEGEDPVLAGVFVAELTGAN
jgi:hypothetical protein